MATRNSSMAFSTSKGEEENLKAGREDGKEGRKISKGESKGERGRNIIPKIIYAVTEKVKVQLHDSIIT